MINGRTFDWESIKVDAPFGIDVEIQDINYKSNRPVNMVFGRGNAARGYGRGNQEQDGDLTLNHKSFLALAAYGATFGGYFRIPPFVITVRYANDDQVTQVDVLDGVVLEEIGTGGAQGDEEVALRKINFKIANPVKFAGVTTM